MVQCPRCSCEFEPNERDLQEDGLNMVSLRCPSCKNNFSIKIQYIAIKVSDVK